MLKNALGGGITRTTCLHEKEVRADAQVITDVPDAPNQVVVLEAVPFGHPKNHPRTVAAPGGRSSS
ncbi:hypothetical protein LX15_003403 [Streptoalloteichus tenebrarius]|uniref:Uncharacterized protein n=1 Tax=Streptoalloteichus tenebrarius (strain ATCC 17920 / DSM 40477 / JCM 4838 / CBS 697.72 / NBRC 16177 / NCIMB 11028 / NRRL B-12390 / A12253. 1 / ISP 5477) TaxID=1933 RepID=A0ABT1HVY3_STRSD|nr:hypothetical protein [Streptoalloteichus tenebrarius]MCP2259697.1 hypothetical protein [Streptoalloteichus tenebrarius]BFF00674.1 hypothetical protein GCM10020241_23490 [Streptoalloteichus tenebrarius]